MTKDSDIKEQWLDFMINCRQHNEIPGNIINTIKQAYQTMEKVQWNPDVKLNYELSVVNKYYDKLQIQRNNEKIELAQEKGEQMGILKGKIEGKIEGEKMGIVKGKIEGEKMGIVRGKIEGKIEGIVKGEIEKFKIFTKLPSDLQGSLKSQFNFEFLKEKHFDYIKQHINDDVDIILGTLKKNFSDI